MAEYLKSHSPQELWKASLKPKDPFKPEDPAKAAAELPAAKPPGTGLTVDLFA